MPKPMIKKKTSKKVGKPASKKNTALREAEKMVEIYEEELATLEELKDNFALNFPDAVVALDEIKQQRDIVMDRISETHVAVQKAKTSVGPFICQRKFKAAGYDAEKFNHICSELEDGEMLLDLLRRGVFKTIPDNGTRKAAGAAVVVVSKDPELSEIFNDAWKEESEMTPSVKDPKIDV